MFMRLSSRIALLFPIVLGTLLANAQVYRIPPQSKTPKLESSQGGVLTAEDIQQRRFLTKRTPAETDAKGAKKKSQNQVLSRYMSRSETLKQRVERLSKIHDAANVAPATQYPGIGLRASIPAGAIPTSVVSGDFNRDGHMDFVMSNGYTDDLWIYFGRGDGTFALPKVVPLTQGISPLMVVAADLRNNGKLDLIVANFDTSSVGVLLGNGDGTFGFEQAYMLPEPPAAVVADDFNRDGKLDVVAVMDTNITPGTSVPELATFFGDNSGTLAAPIITTNWGFYTHDWNIASGDLNGDGLPDLILTGPAVLDGTDVYFNNGDGHFTQGPELVASSAFSDPLDTRIGDMNEDGCPDAVVANANSFAQVLMGDCAGHFGPITMVRMGDGVSAVRLADMNGDGHLDIVTTAVLTGDLLYGDWAGDLVSVALGDGRGNFSAARVYRGSGESYSLAVADFNEDGKPDVVSANTGTDSATVYLNEGGADFGFPEGIIVGSPSGGGVINTPLTPGSFVDLNGDGKMDFVFLGSAPPNNSNLSVTSLINDGTGRFAAPVFSDLQYSWSNSGFGGHRFADFRNTGRADFIGVGQDMAFTAGSERIIFAKSNGDGTFAPATDTPTPGASGTIAVGDFNHDGKLDFVAVNGWTTNKKLTPFLGRGDGTFTAGTPVLCGDSGDETLRVFASDLNRDGHLDILVYTSGNGLWTTHSNVLEFLGNGDGSFRAPINLYSPFQIFNLVDINGDLAGDIMQYDDMWPDGTTTTQGPVRVTSYLGQADGRFSAPTTYTPYEGNPHRLFPYLQIGDPAASSFVADYNGDSKPDSAAFESVLPYLSPSYVQMLVGNGDGTFTPTYDVFDLQKEFSWPKYAYDLDGDGRAEFLELDGNTSSMHVLKATPAPAVQIALESSRVTGGSGCGWVFLNVPSSGATVALSSSVPGVDLPASVTVPPGGLGQQFCFNLLAGFDWHQVFDVRAELGGDVAVAYASASYNVGFQLAVGPVTEQVIYVTHSTSPVPVIITPEPGYSGTIHLSCEGLSTGESCTFDSNDLVVSGGTPATTNVVVHSTANSYDLTPRVVASDGQIAKRQSMTIHVARLNVFIPDGDIRAVTPGSGATSVSIWGIPPYVTRCSGLPAGVTCAFTGDQLPYPNTTGLTLTLNVAAGVPVGTYPFDIIVESSDQSITRHTNVAVALPPDFSVDASPIWLIPGTTMPRRFVVTGINSIYTTVNFVCTTDWGGACTAGSVFVYSGNSELYVNVTVPAGMAMGQHTLTLSGTGAGVTHTYNVPAYIADYSGSADQQSITIAKGGQATVTGKITATQGFSGTVTIACTGNTYVTCFPNANSVQVTGGTPASYSVNIVVSGQALARPARSKETFLVLASLLSPFGLLISVRSRRRAARVVSIVALSVLCAGAMAWVACGGSSSAPPPPPPPHTYTVTVTASEASSSTSRTAGTITVSVPQ